MKYDEHSGNQTAIKKVFGVKIYQERTSSCEYHFNKSVEKHKKFLCNKDISAYEKLCADVKNSVKICKKSVIRLISVQEISVRKPFF